jgi:antitoxin component of MazEF toxin-antitoxin module
LTVTVKQVGGSVAVVIPKIVASEMELEAGTALEITTSGDAIVMRKHAARRARRPLSKIVAQIKPASYQRRRREVSADRPVGKELW